jgi:hypothetical protein
MKEKWIDLVSLAQRFYVCPDCQDCKHAEIEDNSLVNQEVYLYNLRIALRSVGHKITRITKCWNKDGDLDLIVYKTTITKKEHTIAMNLYDDYVKEVYYDREEEESDDEEEEEMEQEKSDDPSI